MTTSAQNLFAQARELPASERETFLRNACGDNAELHLEVQRLLIDAERADSFFGDTEGATLGAEEFQETYAEKEGDVIGSYKLRQSIGEGGFGMVWMAEQSVPISRMVALKVIKAGMDTKEVLARFEAERQALAMMDHPNIAKVLDAGATPTGRPWFAMELVKGIPITDYCDQAGLGTRERLALFGDVCAAIKHAHQKGIIHRDIKPSNVMVTLHGDKPVVKVIDFGIAKATQGKLTDRTLFTRFEQFIGTPVYMSPEQAGMSGADIDTRSDIYSLGILLYELLVGKPPFDPKTLISAGYGEMRRIIREVEPVKPSSRLGTLAGEERTRLAKIRRVEEGKLNKLVEPDLDWIVMKAIEKDRTRRYETTNAFAQDIVRFLSDQPVSATPPRAGYRFRKFARRNKVALRFAAGIALLLVVATVVSSWQAVQAMKAEALATKAEALAKQRLVESEKALADAEAISNFLTGMFESSRPGEEKGGRDVKVADVLDTAVKNLEADLKDQPERQTMLRLTLGATYHALGLYPQAIELQEQVSDFFRDTYGPEHTGTVAAKHQLASSYGLVGRRDEAIKLQEEVLEHHRKLSDPEDRLTLAAMHNLAHSYFEAGRNGEALKLQEEVLELFRKSRGLEHPDTLTAMGNLARSYNETGRRDDALLLQKDVLELSRKVNGPEHPATITAMNNLATFHAYADRLDEALDLQEEVLALRRRVNGPEHPETLGAMRALSNAHYNAGRWDEALKLQEEELRIRRKVNGPEYPETLEVMRRLFFSSFNAGRRDEALKLQEEVVEISRKINGPEHPDTLEAKRVLDESFPAISPNDQAIELGEKVLAWLSKSKGPEHPDTLKTMGNLAKAYAAAGRKEEAEKLLAELEALKAKK